ncbi:Uncharacterised protein [Salmonella enterica subsp. enterica serovar Bovismorbificans]|uniref:Uncharacterized protein n=1 Tax=Salmonella enterica subsp. enterica serovar Bovismorbificans TaxID=58097 RepID=A0A655D9U9_SALET|nr:Uncharacterised protein [Salmonella enterica subsp. enterica serovar Bovismorbificans]
MAQCGVLFRCKRIMDTVFAFANGKNTWDIHWVIPFTEGDSLSGRGFFSQQRKQLACKSLADRPGVTVRALQHSEASITKQADIFIIAPGLHLTAETGGTAVFRYRPELR